MRPQILYITHRVPYPLNKGDRIRTFKFMERLAAKADIHLVTLVREPVSAATRKVLADLCHQVAYFPLSRGRGLQAAAALGLGSSASEGFFFHFGLRNYLATLKQRTTFATVMASSSALRPYVGLFKETGAKIIVDFIDVDSQKWQDYSHKAQGPKKWLYRLEARRVRQTETKNIAVADAVTLVSDAESNLLRRHQQPALNSRVHCVRHATDTSYFSPQPPQPASHEQPYSCVFVGSLDYPPNYQGVLWFVEQVWPQLKASYPAAQFFVVGKSPHPSLKALATVPGVNIIGAVPDVRTWLARCQVVVAPLLVARGVQSKVLEAMAMARATVVSPDSLEGIAASGGQHVLVAHDPQTWHQQISRFWQSPSLRQQFGAAARAQVCQHHAWQQSLAALDSLVWN